MRIHRNTTLLNWCFSKSGKTLPGLGEFLSGFPLPNKGSTLKTRVRLDPSPFLAGPRGGQWHLGHVGHEVREGEDVLTASVKGDIATPKSNSLKAFASWQVGSCAFDVKNPGVWASLTFMDWQPNEQETCGLAVKWSQTSGNLGSGRLRDLNTASEHKGL